MSGVYLYGKEINPETYAICKSDMMIKGNDPENIRFGSTLATDEFSAHALRLHAHESALRQELEERPRKVSSMART